MFLEDLVARLRLDSNEFVRGADVAKQQLGGIGNQATATGITLGNFANLARDRLQAFAGSGNIATRSLQALNRAGVSTGVVVGGGLAVAGAAFAKLATDGVRSFMDLTGEVRGFQRVTGSSAESASRLVGAMRLLGMEPEAATAGFGLLSKTIVNNRDRLSQLGIEVARNRDGTTDLAGTLLNVSDAFNSTEDQAKRNTIALTAFGRQGLSFIPILARGREGLAELFAETERHGLVFSQEDLDRARELGQAQRELRQAWEGLQIEGAKALVPFLTSVTRALELVLELSARIKKMPIVSAGSNFKLFDLDINPQSPGGRFLNAVGVDVKPPAKPRGGADPADERQRQADATAAAVEEEERLAAVAKESADAMAQATRRTEQRTAALRTVSQAVVAALNADVAYDRSLLGLQEAQRAVGQVAVEAAEARMQAAERIRDAEEALAEANREATDEFGQVARAIDRVTDAELALVTAQERAREAQEALTDARRDEAIRLRELREEAEAGADRERQAELRLQQARSDVGKARSRREEELALIAVRDAERNLRDIQQGRAATADELADADAKGIEGSDAVVDARQRVEESERGVEEAQRSLRESIGELARVQREVADRIVEAQREMVEAYREAARVGQEEAFKQQSAQLSLRSAILDVAAAALAKAETDALAAGRSLTESEKYGIIRQRLIDLGISVDQLPSLKEIEVRADTLQAEQAFGHLIGMVERLGTGRMERWFKPEFRQHGGPVRAGRAYIVGEGGRPELFVPDANGTIVPKVPPTFSGSGGGVEQHIHVSDELSNYMIARLLAAAEQGARRALHLQAWSAVT